MDRAGSGIRRLTGLLLAMNLGVLAVGLGLMWLPKKPDAMLEFNGDKLKFLSTPADADAKSHQASAPLEPPPVQSEKPVLAPSCLSWSDLDADRLSAVEAHLKQLGITTDDYEFRLDKRLGWWVYLPPFRDLESLRVAMEDARQKGVTDMAQVRAGKMANAVSLGAFPTLASARAHASSLVAKGLRGVKIGPRPEAGEARLLLLGKKVDHSAEDMAGNWPEGLRPGTCATE